MKKDELINLLDGFINHTGMFFKFLDFCKNEGVELTEEEYQGVLDSLEL